MSRRKIAFVKNRFREIRGRLSATEGPILFTSRPYALNWFKTDVYDRAVRNRDVRRQNKSLPANEQLPLMPADIGFEVVHFESIDNPRFSRAEWDNAKLTMPSHAFDMRYRGLFTRPAGAIYSCFDPACHKIPAGYLPDPKWRLYCGIDFGAPNFAAVFLSEEPGTRKCVAFAEYRPQESRKSADHVKAMQAIVRKAYMKTAIEWAATNNKSVNDWTRLPDVCV